jgi:hypothetical protein
MIMKKVLTTMAFVAVVATAAFMTGCGDDDNNNNNNNNNNTTVNAPAASALQGKTFTLGNGDSLLLGAAGSTYTFTPQGGVAENGTYQYTASGNTATIVTTPGTDGATAATFNLTFTSAANNQYGGTITRTPTGGNPSASTTFNTSGGGTDNGGGGGNTNTNTTTIIAPASVTGKNYLVDSGTNGTVTISFPSGSTYTIAAGGSAVETGTYTYTASTTTNTAVLQLNPTTAGATPNTVNLTFNSVTANAESGTVSESDGANGTFTQTGSNGINTSGGGGTNPAPAALHSLHVISTGGPFVGANYTITLNGNGNSGSFDIGGGSTGSGTYTYAANGNNGTLILDYTSEGAVGDNDTMNLAFTSASGGNFTGSQKTGGVQHNDFTGTFDSAN